MTDTWRPTATRELLQKRAAALAQVRAFFAARNVMEVDTPIVVNAPVSDVHIHSAEVRFPDDPTAHMTAAGPGATSPPARFFLHTSPEFAMKRLLAAGSGDIYQICHVVRGLESGRQHNPEFTMVEWYRNGFSLEQLMDEVDALARAVLGSVARNFTSERVTYRDAFLNELGIDPLTCAQGEMEHVARDLGLAPTSATRDELLDFIMATHIGPRLGRSALTFIHRYPASQAALARLDSTDPRCALRFELYCEGIELANGFHELASAVEQRARFEQDLLERARRGLLVHAYDERLLAALSYGLPNCAGVALGFDRLLMLAASSRHISEALAFPTDRA